MLKPPDLRVFMEADPQLFRLGVGAGGLVAGVRPRFLFEKPLGELVYDAWVGHWLCELHGAGVVLVVVLR